MYLTCPPKFCTTFVLHFSSVLQPSREKLKIILMQIFFGGGGGKGQTRCIMGDVQVAYAYSLHPGPKSAGKRKSAGHYGMMSSSHKAVRPRTSSYNFKVYFHRMHSRTGFLIIGCKILLSWSKVVPYSALIPLRGFELL